MVSATNGKRPTSAGVSGAEAWLELFLPPECLPVLMIFQRDAFLFFCVPVSLWRAFRSPSSLGGFYPQLSLYDACVGKVGEIPSHHLEFGVAEPLDEITLTRILCALYFPTIAFRYDVTFFLWSFPRPPNPHCARTRGDESVSGKWSSPRRGSSDTTDTATTDSGGISRPYTIDGQ